MLNYSIQGSGNTCLVLLHGFCENNTCFDEQVLLFKDHCKVILPDLPGFGKSPVISEVSIDQMARELNDLLVALGIERCVMMGHSMGGYVSLAFAKLFPHKLSGLGLIHSTVLADSPERMAKRDQVVKFVQENGKEAYIQNFIPGLFKESNRSKTMVTHAIANAMRGPQEGIIAAALAMKSRLDQSEWLKDTSLPVFFGIGKQDELIPAEVMITQASSCKRSEIALLTESAHMGMQEEPMALAQAILTFLRNFKLI